MIKSKLPGGTSPIAVVTADDAADVAQDLIRARAFAEPLIAYESLDTGENTLAHADAVVAILQSIGGSAALQTAIYSLPAAALTCLCTFTSLLVSSASAA